MPEPQLLPPRRRQRADVAPLATADKSGARLEAWFASHPAAPCVFPDGDAAVGYYRKSSDDPNKQVLSIWDQRREVEQHHGRPLPVYFYEQQSGTTFADRQAFQALYAFCQANRRPKQSPGVIKAWDYDRFSRQCDEAGDPDLDEMLRVILEFKRLGWIWYFIQSPPQGTRLADLIVGVIKFQESADKSAQLMRDVPRGLRTRALDPEGTQGGAYWLGNEAPYPALRRDARTGRVLGPYERSDHGTVLDRDPHLYPTWEFAARRILAGDRAASVAGLLTRMHLADPASAPYSPGQRSWRRNHVVQMLTHPALIGEPVYHLKSGTVQVKAAWDPIVDVALFHAVGRALAAHRRQPGRSPQRGGRVLDLTCPRCDGVYHSAVAHGGRRVYVHPNPKHATAENRERAAGCRTFSVDAETVEAEVLRLIREERMSDRWAEYMRAEYDRHATVEQDARQVEAAAEATYRALQRDHDTAVRNLARARDDETFALLETEVARVRRERDQAHQRWQAARAGTNQVSDHYRTIDARINESTQLLAAFRTGDLAVRRRLFDMWVDYAELAPVPLPDPPRKRHDRRFVGTRTAKQLTVVLQSSPEDPKAVQLPTGYAAAHRRRPRPAENIDPIATGARRDGNYAFVVTLNPLYGNHLRGAPRQRQRSTTAR